MESAEPNSTDRAENTATTLKLIECDRTHWEAFEDAFIGACGTKKAPLLMDLETYVRSKVFSAATDDKSTAEHTAPNEYAEASDYIHNKLAVATRASPKGRTIVCRYAAGTQIEGAPEGTVSLLADGRSAWLKLKETAMGGLGKDTAESYISQIFSMQPTDMEPHTMLSRHQSLYHRLRNISGVTVDLILKMHLLRMARGYDGFEVVEDKCATDPNISYEDTQTHLNTRLVRMQCSEVDNSTALAANSARVRCFRCNQLGHFANECKVTLPADSTDAPAPGEGKSQSARRNRKYKEQKAKLAEAEALLATVKKKKKKKSQKRSDSDASSSDYEEFAFGFAGEARERYTFSTLLLPVFILSCFTTPTPKLNSLSEIATFVIYIWAAIVLMDAIFDQLSAECLVANTASDTQHAVLKMVIDSGATKHLVGERAVFTDYRRMDGKVRIANNSFIDAIGIGSVKLSATDTTGCVRHITLNNVWHVPGVGNKHLFSVRAFRKQLWGSLKQKGRVSFDDELKLSAGVDSDGVNIVFPFHESNSGEYFWSPVVDTATATTALAERPPASVNTRKLKSSANLYTWHKRFGHLAADSLKALQPMVRNMTVNNKDTSQPPVCSVCVEANQKRKPRSERHAINSTRPLERVHCDNVEGFSVKSMGKRCGYLFVDDYSRSKFFYPVTKKSEFPKALAAFITRVRSKSRLPAELVLVESLQTDWASELSAGLTKEYCDKNGIKLTHSSPGVHEENGVVERAIDTVKRVARAVHRTAGFPKHFWVFSMLAACHILQFAPQSRFGGSTSYQRFYDAIPDVSHLRTVGCLTYAFNWYVQNKNFHTPRGLKTVMLGYCDSSRSYILWRCDTKSVIRSSEVVFDETVFPFHGQTAPDTGLSFEPTWGQADTDDLHLSGDPTVEQTEIAVLAPDTTGRPAAPVGAAPVGAQVHIPQFQPPPVGAAPVGADPVGAQVDIPQFQPPLRQPVVVIPRLNPPPALRRSRRDASYEASLRIRNQSARSAQVGECGEVSGLNAREFSELSSQLFETSPEAECRLASAVHPSADVFEPLNHREAMQCCENKQWSAAEHKEMDGLERLGVFEYVPTSSVPSHKKVISNKWVYKVKPDRHKARVVIRGFLQDDAGETFSPTIKLVTLRLMFAVAAMLQWTLKQMDVCNAFLNAEIKDEVYMRCVDGFERPGMVIRLRKALYGLKGSPRAWYQHLHDLLLKLELTQCLVDSCLYMLIVDDIVVLLVGCYVDDLLIVGNTTFVSWFAAELTKVLLMENLGKPTRLLGIDIHYTDTTIKLSQETYIKKILNRFNMADATPKHTPMEHGLKLSKSMEGTPEEINHFPYRAVVACLIYLVMCSRPDIAFAVKELSGYLERPGTQMVKAAKRVLRYLKHTINLGLVYSSAPKTLLGGLYSTVWRRKGSWVPPVAGYSDADWASRVDDRKSTAGILVVFNGCALAWSSKTLRTVALSTQDAEYMALSNAAREVVFIRQLVSSIGFKLEESTPLFGENAGSLTLVDNPCDHQKSKHIQIRYHYIRQLANEKQVVVGKVDTAQQLADILTKALRADQHELLCIHIFGLK